MPGVYPICERALSLVGATDLRELDSGWRAQLEALDYSGLLLEHAPIEAVSCARHFARIRDTLFETYPWVFARKSAALAQLATPLTGWRFAYALPSDCAKLLDLVWGRLSIEKWERDGGTIGCEYRPVTARYTARINDPSLWPGEFESVMCAKLAIAIAPIVSKGFGGYSALESAAASTIIEGYRSGAIDPVRRLESHSYAWDRYSNDLYHEYLGGDLP
jgi:hypothetical protein